MVVRRFRSSRIHIVDVSDPSKLEMKRQMIEPDEIIDKERADRADTRSTACRRHSHDTRCSADRTDNCPVAFAVRDSKDSRSRG